MRLKISGIGKIGDSEIEMNEDDVAKYHNYRRRVSLWGLKKFL
jgi:hypothetical protein